MSLRTIEIDVEQASRVSVLGRARHDHGLLDLVETRRLRANAIARLSRTLVGGMLEAVGEIPGVASLMRRVEALHLVNRHGVRGSILRGFRAPGGAGLRLREDLEI